MKRIPLFLAAMLLATMASAASGIRVAGGWARAMPPVTHTTAGYLVIENRGGKADLLLGVCIDGVETAEVHEMIRNGDTMVMRHRESLVIPAGGKVELAPGGLHLMLINADKALVAGTILRGTLHFRDAGDVAVALEVRGP